MPSLTGAVRVYPADDPSRPIHDATGAGNSPGREGDAPPASRGAGAGPPAPGRRLRRAAAVLSSLVGGLGLWLSLHVFLPEAIVEPAPPRVAPAPPSPVIRVLAYNVHLLPGLADTLAAKVGRPEARARRIGEFVAAYDLVGLCEVFDRDRASELLAAVERVAPGRHSVVRGPKPSGYFTGSGLLLLSRFPVEAWHRITFGEASRFAEFGWRADGFAAKGALHARVRHDSGVRIDCFVTHLESKSGPARAVQVEALARFIGELSAPDRPIVLMGDLNVNADPAGGEATAYGRMMAGLADSGRTMRDVWPLLRGKEIPPDGPVGRSGRQRKDYVLVSAPAVEAAGRLEPRSVRILPLYDGEIPGGAWSDHPAVECEARVVPAVDPAGAEGF